MDRKIIVGITQGDTNGVGYEVIITNLIPDSRSQTRLDTFLDGIDDDASEIIIGLMGDLTKDSDDPYDPKGVDE